MKVISLFNPGSSRLGGHDIFVTESQLLMIESQHLLDEIRQVEDTNVEIADTHIKQPDFNRDELLKDFLTLIEESMT